MKVTEMEVSPSETEELVGAAEVKAARRARVTAGTRVKETILMKGVGCFGLAGWICGRWIGCKAFWRIGKCGGL